MALEKLKGTSVLVVRGGDGFLDKGGIINLALHDHNVRVEVNLDAARANPKTSSKLLGVANVVRGKR